MRRVMRVPQATVRCLLVVDATTGQKRPDAGPAFREAAA